MWKSNKCSQAIENGGINWYVAVFNRLILYRNRPHSLHCGLQICCRLRRLILSYFERFVWDLENRGVADIDIPVLIIGIDV